MNKDTRRNYTRNYLIPTLFFSSVTFVSILAVIKLSSLLSHIGFLLLLSFILSSSMELPVSILVKRKVPRRVAALVVLIGSIVGVIALIASIGTVVSSEFRGIAVNLEQYVNEIANWVSKHGYNLTSENLMRYVEDVKSSISDKISNSAKTAENIVVDFGIITFLSYYLVSDGYKFRIMVCKLLPAKAQQMVLDIWQTTIEKTGSYLVTRLILIAVSSLLTGAICAALGMPYAWALGIWFGVISQAIPIIGTYIGMSIPLLVAANYGLVVVLILVAFIILYQLFENYFLMPKIAANTLKMHPAPIFLSVIVGATLAGGLGAIIAIPIAATIQSVLSTYSNRHEIVHGHDLLLDPTIKSQKTPKVKK